MSESAPAERREMEELLGRLLPAFEGLDLAAPDAAERLEAAHPMDGPLLERLRHLCAVGLADGWLAPREAGPRVRFGRLAKDFGGYAVDCVLMEGEALGHTHPRGEINIGFAWEGEPRFDGQPAGWSVYPPGSHHVPTVTDGKMLFVYFTPGGEVIWDARA